VVFGGVGDPAGVVRLVDIAGPDQVGHPAALDDRPCQTDPTGHVISPCLWPATALELGGTLKRLGELLGVTPARVGQMRDGK
jgi:hypothetical protein